MSCNQWLKSKCELEILLLILTLTDLAGCKVFQLLQDRSFLLTIILAHCRKFGKSWSHLLEEANINSLVKIFPYYYLPYGNCSSFIFSFGNTAWTFSVVLVSYVTLMFLFATYKYALIYNLCWKFTLLNFVSNLSTVAMNILHMYHCSHLWQRLCIIFH